MLFAELGFVLWIRGMTIRGYLEARNSVSGTIYFMALGAFAVMPLFATRPRA